MADTVAQLRERLALLHGPPRVPVLVELGQELGRMSWRNGPGNLDALAPLSAAVDAFNEAYHLMDPADPARRTVGALLGWTLSNRYSAHGSSEADRETAMSLLDEALAQPGLASVHQALARMTLGQLYLGRAMEAMTPSAARNAFREVGPAGALANLDEAARRFQEVIDGPVPSAEVTAVCESLLLLAESFRSLLTGDLDTFDLTKMIRVMTEMQRLVEGGLPVQQLGWPKLTDFKVGEPLDRPVVTLGGDLGRAAPIAPNRPIALPPPADPERSRRAARARLATLVQGRTAPVWEQAGQLLEAGPDRVLPAELDAYISAAANAVDAGEHGDPVESGLDHLLSAVGLCLRAQRDGDGWGDEPVTGASAIKPLLIATTLVPAAHPAAAVVVETLGGLLSPGRPLAGVPVEVAAPLADYAAAVGNGNGTVAAFGRLCQVICTVAADAEPDPDPLADAIEQLPLDSPWRGVLATALGQVRLLASVRTGVPVAVDSDPDGLAALLEAMLAADLHALRAAVDSLAVTARTGPVAALVGAAQLELAIRATVAERDDLAAAIRQLSAAAELLGATHEWLRTRTWGRLAEAYRRRGEPGDDESSRRAGLAALSGPGWDARSAARFAGWMLADGHASEAFAALELAAAGAERPEPARGPLVADIVQVIVGIAPPAVRSTNLPDWPEVAAAVRKAGASALLYLHPTDEAGRTAGVLCLDPGTDRLDVIANVPVTDPLTSDDPGWSTIAGRWQGGLLVAATGELRRLALPAVCAGNGRRLAQDVSIGYVSSGAQVIDLVGRSISPVWKAPLFVVNPRGDRDAEMADVLVLRRLFYPQSACIGHALEAADGPGTRADLIGRLPGSSLVHLACGVRDTEAELAGQEVADLTAVPGSGIVILAQSRAEGSGTTAERLLRAGYRGVIGWQRPVPPSFAALALFMTHLMLVDHRMPPPAAVAAVQRWLLDPGRELPVLLPDVHRHTIDTVDLTRPGLWAALAYHGC